MLGQSGLATAAYFLLAELLSSVGMGRTLYRLQIRELFAHSRRNSPQDPGRRWLWPGLFLIGVLSYFLMLQGMSSSCETIVTLCIGLIAARRRFCITAFYKSLFGRFSVIRRVDPDAPLAKNRLLWIGELTTNGKINANLNVVFCVCLIFSFYGVYLRRAAAVWECADLPGSAVAIAGWDFYRSISA